MDLNLPGAEVSLFTDFLSQTEADRLLDIFSRDLPWEQHNITVYGKTYPQPRLTAWFGDSQEPYTYSKLTLTPSPLTKELEELRDKLFDFTSHYFNSILGNKYRAGKRDSIGMHSDDEPELGVDPTIASVSLGRSCDFLMTPRHLDLSHQTTIKLTHGSLLLMGPGTQKNWLHGIKKDKMVPEKERINLTFRNIYLK